VIYYGVAWHETRPLNPQTLSVDLGDIRGFMEACSNIDERELDLILHAGVPQLVGTWRVRE